MKNKPLQNRKKNLKWEQILTLNFKEFCGFATGWFVKKKMGNTSGEKQPLFLSWRCTVQSYIKAFYLCQWWAKAAWKEQWQRLLWIQQSAQPYWWEVAGSIPRTWSQEKQKRLFKKFKPRNAKRQNLLFSIKLQLLHTTLQHLLKQEMFFSKQALKFSLLVSLIL